MPTFAERYRQGECQQVSDELLALQEHLFEEQVSEDGLQVMKEIMSRVRYNLHLIISRLSALGYQFGEGFWDQFGDLPLEERSRIERDLPVYGSPPGEVLHHLAEVEQLTGTLPHRY